MGAWASAVDFVGHQQLAEHRARDEAEGAAAVFGFFQHFGTDDVARHQIGRELDALGVEPEHKPKCIDESGLGEARHADQKSVAAGQKRDQDLIDDGLLAEDDIRDGFARSRKAGAQFLRLGFGVGAVEFGGLLGIRRCGHLRKFR